MLVSTGTPPLRSTQQNMLSASQHPGIINDYIQSKRSEGRVVSLVHAPASTAVHSSPIGVIPKKHLANGWRLIMELSSPLGQSVNDGTTAHSSI